MKLNFSKSGVVLLLTIIASAELVAAEIFHWVDENGVAHYSQNPPAGDTPNVSTQTIETPDLPENGEGEDIYNVKEHEERMIAWREERDKERKEARELKNQTVAQRPYEYRQQNDAYPWPYIYPPGNRPPIRPPIEPPHNPDRPIFNPRPPPTAIHHDG
jgi:hypothetical protein